MRARVVVVVVAVAVAVARSDAEKTRGGDRSPDVASRGGDGDGDVADPAPGEDRVHRRVVVRALAVLPQRGRDVRLHRIRPVQRELLHVGAVPRFVIASRPARERRARARGRDDEREERRGTRARDAKTTWGSRRGAPAARGRHPEARSRPGARSTRAPRVEEVPALLLTQRRVCANQTSESLIGDLMDKMQVDTRLLSKLTVILKVKSGVYRVQIGDSSEVRGSESLDVINSVTRYEDFHAVIGREVGRP